MKPIEIGILKEYHQPSVELWGLRIDEPVTALTDVLVAAVCFYAFFKLHKIPVRNKVHKFLKWYFMTMGIATFVGGVVGHAFIYALSFEWKLIGWLTSMFSVASVERAVISHARRIINPKVGKFFGWVNIIELSIFVFLSMYFLDFHYVEIHTGYGFGVVVLGFSVFVYAKTKSKSSELYIKAVAWSAIGATFYFFKWGFHPFFNHFDVCHIFMAISAYWFYLAADNIVNEEF